MSGKGSMRDTGLLAMSAVVSPARLRAFTSAPFETRYSIIALSPRAAALCLPAEPELASYDDRSAACLRIGE